MNDILIAHQNEKCRLQVIVLEASSVGLTQSVQSQGGFLQENKAFEEITIYSYNLVRIDNNF